MENEKKKPQKKQVMRLTDEQKKKVYKDEKKKYQEKWYNELREGLIVGFGSFLLALYIVCSSLIISIGSVMYVVAIGADEIKDAFINNPLGVSCDLAFLAIVGFAFWLGFGMFSIILFLKSNKILEQKPELYKKLKIWNWRNK